MAYVIGSQCVDVKDASCVVVCPVDCIHPTPEDDHFGEVDQLFIDPQACIDCGVCKVECPVDAIYADDEVPDDEIPAIRENAAYFD